MKERIDTALGIKSARPATVCFTICNADSRRIPMAGGLIGLLTTLPRWQAIRCITGRCKRRGFHGESGRGGGG